MLTVVALYYLFQGPQKVKYGNVGFSETEITAKNIIIATGSVPFVPKGIEIDGNDNYLSLWGFCCRVAYLSNISFS